jgi:hypothetical protein
MLLKRPSILKMSAEVESLRDGEQRRTVAELRYSCLAILIPLFTLLCVALYLTNLRESGNSLIYPLDDAYIHMSLAKNLALHGVFGVTADGFTACSSSPLWVFLISAVYALVGVHTWPPLAFGFFFGLILIVAACEILLRSGASRFSTIFSVTALCLFIPLPVLVLSGMEHVLHILLSVLLMFWAASFITEPRVPAWMRFALPTTIAAAVMIRFETLFLVGAIVLLLLLRRRFLPAGLFLGAALAPIAILGLYSVSKGWFFLPTSLLLKGRMPEFLSLASVVRSAGFAAFSQLLGTPHLMIAMVALVVIYLWRGTRGASPWDRGQVMICLSLITILVHLQYARLNFNLLGRYEGYLLGMAILSVGCADLSVVFQNLRAAFAKKSNILEFLPLSIAVLLVLAPLFQHGVQTATQFPAGRRSLYRQQYQMARFLAAYYNTSSVAANDIGAVNFFTRIRCLDLYGLANREICRLKLAGRFDTRALNQLAMAENTRVAIVYDSWFQDQLYNQFFSPRLPASWRRVAVWRTEGAVLSADDHVTFYAVNPAEALRLKQSLSQFASQLPSGTVQSLLPE